MKAAPCSWRARMCVIADWRRGAAEIGRVWRARGPETWRDPPARRGGAPAVPPAPPPPAVDDRCHSQSGEGGQALRQREKETGADQQEPDRISEGVVVQGPDPGKVPLQGVGDT